MRRTREAMVACLCAPLALAGIGLAAATAARDDRGGGGGGDGRAWPPSPLSAALPGLVALVAMVLLLLACLGKKQKRKQEEAINADASLRVDRDRNSTIVMSTNPAYKGDSLRPRVDVVTGDVVASVDEDEESNRAQNGFGRAPAAQAQIQRAPQAAPPPSSAAVAAPPPQPVQVQQPPQQQRQPAQQARPLSQHLPQAQAQAAGARAAAHGYHRLQQPMAQPRPMLHAAPPGQMVHPMAAQPMMPAPGMGYGHAPPPQQQPHPSFLGGAPGGYHQPPPGTYVQPVPATGPPRPTRPQPSQAAQPPMPARRAVPVPAAAPGPGIDPLFAGQGGAVNALPVPQRASKPVDPGAPPAVVRSAKPGEAAGPVPARPVRYQKEFPPTPVPEGKKMALTSASEPVSKSLDSDLAAWQLARNKLSLDKALGEGFFGAVFRGTYKDATGQVASCAIKSLRPDNNAITDKDKKNFLIEALILMEFRHPHVLWLVGVSTVADPWYIITELLELGDLKQLLLMCKEAGKTIETLEQLQLCQQVASGMGYLASKQFIHRDLAARNCLVSGGGVVKIGDFGMSRLVIDEDDYYKAQGEDALPIRWMALESMEHYRFTLKSDVWSFGVVIWEVFSYAGLPYGEMNPMIISYKVSEGMRPEQPDKCPDSVYALISTCWAEDARARPNFAALSKSLRREIRDLDATPSQDTAKLFRELMSRSKPGAFESEVDAEPGEAGNGDYEPLRAPPTTATAGDGDGDGDGDRDYEPLHAPPTTAAAAAPSKTSPYNQMGGYHKLSDMARPATCSPYHKLKAPPGGFDDLPTPALPVVESDPYHDLDDVHKTYAADRFGGDDSILAMGLPAGLDVHAEWFHGRMNRTVAERVLLSQGRVSALDGVFLVRASSKAGASTVSLAVSLVFQGQVWHYKIGTLPSGYFSFYGREYPTVADLVKHHSTNKENMLAPLQQPAVKC